MTVDALAAPVRVRSLAYLVLRTTRIKEWSTFAEDVIGCQVLAAADGALSLRWDARVWRVRLVPAAEDELEAVGWDVGGSVDFRRAVNELEAAGHEVQVASPREAAGREVAEMARVQDPNGTRIELVHGQRESSEPVTSRHAHRFVAGPLGAGHVVLAADDYAATLEFYERALGFRLSDTLDLGKSRVAFMHCNARHHSLAFAGLVEELASGARRPPVDPGELFHFMVELDDLDSVGRAYDRCLAGAAPITQSLGRHTNDAMTSFYALTPSGFEIEVGFGGRLLEPGHIPTQLSSTSRWGHARPARSEVRQ